MSDDNELRRERDRSLADAYHTYAWGLRTHLSNWIEEEAYHAEVMLEMIETMAMGGPPELIADLHNKRQQINDVRIRERKEAERWMAKKCQDIREEIYDDPLDARIYIDEGVWRYESAIRTLLHVRKFIDLYSLELGGDSDSNNDDGEIEEDTD